jgi:hypothetical protein
MLSRKQFYIGLTQSSPENKDAEMYLILIYADANEGNSKLAGSSYRSIRVLNITR